MLPEEQKRIVSELCDNLKAKVLQAIQDGKIPTSWNGFELRHVLRDMMADQCLTMDPARARRYKNTRLVNNL